MDKGEKGDKGDKREKGDKVDKCDKGDTEKAGPGPGPGPLSPSFPLSLLSFFLRYPLFPYVPL